MIHNIEDLEPKHKVKLSVPLIASYIDKGCTQADIARRCNVSYQAVSNYIKRHYDDLAPLLGSNNIMIMKAKHIASKAQDNIAIILDDKPEKKDLFALNAVSGTHIDKMRLLSDQSTSNISIDAIHTRREDIQKRLKELRERRMKLTGSETYEERPSSQ
jgi:predicted transcriptional regulator